MNPEEYIEKRVDPQIGWYDLKSQKNKRYHVFSKSFVIVAATMIPFLSGFLTTDADNERLIWAIIALGLLTAVFTGLSSVFKFQEKWNKYRTTCESLKHQKFLFLTGSGHYTQTNKNSFEDFVFKTEKLISEENSNWKTYIDQDESFQ